MPTAEERDEQDAQDPFARSLKEPGYRVAARIERPPDRRPQIVTGLVAATIVLAIVIAALRIQVDQTAALPTPRPLASGLAGLATQLPALSVLGSAGAIAPFPVLSGGLRWLDAATGTISGPPFSGARGWIFGGSDGGAWCICFDSPWSPTGIVERTTIVRYGSTGTELERTTVDQIQSDIRAGDSILRDVTRSTDGRDLFVASARRDATGWMIGLDRVSLVGTPAKLDSTDLGHVNRATGGTLINAPVVRAAPFDRIVRVTVRFADRTADGSPPAWREQAWDVPVDGPPGSAGAGLGTATTAGPRPGLDPDRCDSEAWATPDTYVVLCRDTIGESLVPIAHVEPLTERTRTVQVGEPIGRDDLDWLVDAGAGKVYRWSRFSHVIAALDVTSGDVVERIIEPGSSGLAGVGTDTSRPPGRDARALWAQLASAADVPRERLAGSVDGTLLYAVGVQAGAGTGVSGPLLASTGIWAFDTQTLGIVGHWPAVAMYDQVATSPDGRSVLAVGLEGMTADGLLADWDSSLVIHDAGDGHAVEQIGHLVGDEGFFVDLLAPGPAP